MVRLLLPEQSCQNRNAEAKLANPITWRPPRVDEEVSPSFGMFALEPQDRSQQGERGKHLTVPSSMSLRHEPKSARRMWPFMSSRILSGFMSLKREEEEALLSNEMSL